MQFATHITFSDFQDKSGEYCWCWYPGSLHPQAICRHGIDSAHKVGPAIYVGECINMHHLWAKEWWRKFSRIDPAQQGWIRNVYYS